MSESKPCPCCGSPVIMGAPNMHGKTHVLCPNCFLESAWGTPEEVAAKWNRRAQPDNAPLTLDELRGMEERGEAIYVCKIDETPIFRGNLFTAAVLDTTQAFGTLNGLHLQAIYGRQLTLAEGDYGKTWLAYRRPPERSENDA